jgi:hypothetical protein
VSGIRKEVQADKKRDNPVTPKADPPDSSSGVLGRVPPSSPRSFSLLSPPQPVLRALFFLLEQSTWRPTLPSLPCWLPAPSLFLPRWTDRSGYLPTPRSRAAAGGPAASFIRNPPNLWNILVTRLHCPISMLTGSMPRVSRACMNLFFALSKCPDRTGADTVDGNSSRKRRMNINIAELS